MIENNTFREGVDYYMEDGRLVMTEYYLTKIRKSCCGNNCRYCCFIPKGQKGSTNLNKKGADDTF